MEHEHLEDEGLDNDALNRLGIDEGDEPSIDPQQENWANPLDNGYPSNASVTASDLGINTIALTNTVSGTLDQIDEANDRISALEVMVNALKTEVEMEKNFSFTEIIRLEEKIMRIEKEMEKDDGQDVS